MEGLGLFILIVYFVLHIPSFTMLIIGLSIRKSKPKTAKVLLILSGDYFVVRGGICRHFATGMSGINLFKS